MDTNTVIGVIIGALGILISVLGFFFSAKKKSIKNQNILNFNNNKDSEIKVENVNLGEKK